MFTLEQLNNNLTWRGKFKNAWEDCNRSALFELARDINPSLTDKECDRGWQYTTCFNHSFQYSKQEFIILVNQTF